MPTKKAIPRAVLEERLRILEEAKTKRRMFAVKSGVYLVLVAGVIASQVIVMADDLNATFKVIEIGQVVGAILTSMILYRRMESKGELKGKIKNVRRVLMNAFFLGFTWMTMIGAWW